MAALRPLVFSPLASAKRSCSARSFFTRSAVLSYNCPWKDCGPFAKILEACNARWCRSAVLRRHCGGDESRLRLRRRATDGQKGVPAMMISRKEAGTLVATGKRREYPRRSGREAENQMTASGVVPRPYPLFYSSSCKNLSKPRILTTVQSRRRTNGTVTEV